MVPSMGWPAERAIVLFAIIHRVQSRVFGCSFSRSFPCWIGNLLYSISICTCTVHYRLDTIFLGLLSLITAHSSFLRVHLSRIILMRNPGCQLRHLSHTWERTRRCSSIGSGKINGPWIWREKMHCNTFSGSVAALGENVATLLATVAAEWLVE
jgi:hypothetical protein